MVKKANEVAIRQSASHAARAWTKLEAAAQEAMNGGAAPSLQLIADTAGIVAHISDAHGTSVVVERGRISVNVAPKSE